MRKNAPKAIELTNISAFPVFITISKKQEDEYFTKLVIPRFWIKWFHTTPKEENMSNLIMLN